MALKEDLESEVSTIFRSQWIERQGLKVPEPADLKLGNDGVVLDAVCLYADMAQSTHLVDTETPHIAAEIYKSFLHCASKLISAEGGTITSFDGDRVMGIFLGDQKNTSAVRCALKIQRAVIYIINPKLKGMYSFAQYTVAHSCGIDRSKILATRTGIRGSNDIVWVGRAANYAAKLCEMRVADYSTWITSDVYDMMQDDVKFSGTPPQNMWEKTVWPSMANKTVYRSRFWWTI